jgi:hypothetical protein
MAIAATPALDEASLFAKAAVLAQPMPVTPSSANLGVMIRAALRSDIALLKPRSMPSWIERWVEA